MSRVGATMELGEDLDTYAELYRRMLLIRGFEDRVQSLFLRGEVYGTTHLYSVQEAVAVGVCAHLRADDVIFSTHRGHGHALAKGVPPRALMAELFGRATGCSQGRGGSMHLFAPEVGLMGTSGIVGPSILQATGAGYSFKLLQVDRVAVAFFGDGAVNNGAFHEGLNLASIWRLPVLFVCENNEFATEVPFRYASGNPSVAARGAVEQEALRLGPGADEVGRPVPPGGAPLDLGQARADGVEVVLRGRSAHDVKRHRSVRPTQPGHRGPSRPRASASCRTP